MKSSARHGFSAWCQAIELSEQILGDTCDFTNHPLAYKIESTALRFTQILGDCCNAGATVTSSVMTAIKPLWVSLQIELALAHQYRQINDSAMERLMAQLCSIGGELGFEEPGCSTTNACSETTAFTLPPTAARSMLKTGP